MTICPVGKRGRESFSDKGDKMIKREEKDSRPLFPTAAIANG
jgi:hypothetical protein